MESAFVWKMMIGEHKLQCYTDIKATYGEGHFTLFLYNKGLRENDISS